MKILKCDICNKQYNDFLEIQEFIHIDHSCGYGSIIGDGRHLEFDICQNCWKNILPIEKKEYSISDFFVEVGKNNDSIPFYKKVLNTLETYNNELYSEVVNVFSGKLNDEKCTVDLMIYIHEKLENE